MMKFKMKAIFLFTTILILLSGCKKKEEIIVEKPEESTPEVEVIEEVNPNIGKAISPLSGIYVEEEKLDRRVIAIMFDNHPRARWQAGLKDAEVVYEYEVEAPYTRYLGVFLSNDPSSLGPLRSARPYFVSTVLEYDAAYVRVGGSREAEKDIKDYNIDDLDARKLSSSVFWRKSHKKAPNNLYSDMKTLREAAEGKGINDKKNIDVFSFAKEDRNISGTIAEDIKIIYNSTNTTDYSYNKDGKIYYRKKDGKDHIDEIDDTPITAKNIIIREVAKRTLPDGKKLEMDLVGRGKGKYITNGTTLDINWSKKSREARTIYTLDGGQELRLNPGVTFVQVVHPKTEITIN